MNSGIGSNFELLAFCFSIRSGKVLRADSSAICRFYRVEWANSSGVVDLPTCGIPKIISIDYLACRPNTKKNDVLCIVELKNVS